MIFALAGCGESNGQKTNKGPILLTPSNGAVVEILPLTMQNYIDSMHEDYVHTFVSDYSSSWSDTPVILSWGEDGSSEYEVSVSTRQDMLGAKKIVVTEETCSLNNLLADTVYYWTVKSKYGTAETGSFRTRDTTRWLAVDGAKNVRDLGNYTTKTGERVKQGMLYRGTELNYRLNISESGKNTMLNDLKIKTEIDLRWGNQTSDSEPITVSPLGNTVNYYNLPIVPYADLNVPFYNNPEYENYPIENRQNLHYIFSELLSDESAYPIYFHCYYGADRTGCLAFLISGLLGVSYPDLISDYEQTTFGMELRTRDLSYYYGSELRKFQNMLRSYGDDDDDWQKLCSSFLKEYVGVTKQEIAKIKEILLI